jgi:hypothetical protein
MNFEWNGKLAQRQDDAMKDYLLGIGFHPKDVKMFKENLMVPIAAVLAPCNLVARHYCLLYLITKDKKYLNKTAKQCRKLTNGVGELWAEGYSYWMYTRYMLFSLKNYDVWMGAFIVVQDRYFELTAYERNGRHYPAPFGDVWDSPLETEPLPMPPKEPILPVYMVNDKYYHIKSRPVGFNLHTARVDKIYFLENGIPVNFNFYKGYKEKYPTLWSELKALGLRLIELLTTAR